jgi:hypothetical protein
VKMRLTGTRTECDRFTTELIAATPPGVVREVSGFYPNRGNSALGRVYLDLDLPPADPRETPVPVPARRGDAHTAGTGSGPVRRGGRRAGDRRGGDRSC